MDYTDSVGFHNFWDISDCFTINHALMLKLLIVARSTKVLQITKPLSRWALQGKNFQQSQIATADEFETD